MRRVLLCVLAAQTVALWADEPVRDWHPSVLSEIALPMLASEASPPVFALIEESAGMEARPEGPMLRRRLEVAIWPNGTVLWTHPDEPAHLKAGHVSPEALDLAFQAFVASAELNGSPVQDSGLHLPDGGSFTLWVASGETQVAMSSGVSLDQFSVNGRSMATANGLESLHGRDGEEVLGAQPPAFLLFRQRWLAGSGTALDLVPTSGESIDGAAFEWQVLGLSSSE